MNNAITQLACKALGYLNTTRKAEFLAPLALRLYLAPVFWVAGMNKFNAFDGTVGWFGEHGLGLPFPALMAFMATATEILGAIMLFFGIAVRWVSIPLMCVMLVAIFLVHLKNGWQAVADSHSPFAGDNVSEALERLGIAREILREHGNYDWLTEYGSLVVSNNGIEWGVTYFVMLLVLFFIGGGAASVDRLVCKTLAK